MEEVNIKASSEVYKLFDHLQAFQRDQEKYPLNDPQAPPLRSPKTRGHPKTSTP